MKLFVHIVLGVWLCILVPEYASAQSEPSSVFAEDSCGKDQFSLDLGSGFPKTGAIEILYPQPDTDGRNSKRYLANKVVCIDLAELMKVEKSIGTPEDGLSDYEATFFVTYDPAGSLSHTRSRFDYSVLMCEELPDTPRPPAELKFGTFNWTIAAGIKSERVTWIKDLRAQLEEDCREVADQNPNQ